MLSCLILKCKKGLELVNIVVVYKLQAANLDMQVVDTSWILYSRIKMSIVVYTLDLKPMDALSMASTQH